MNETTTREKIFKSIRNALIDKAANPYPDLDFETSVYAPMRETPDVTFAQEFTRVAGKFVYCEDRTDLAEKLKYIVSRDKNGEVYCFEQSLKPLLEEHEIPLIDHAGSLEKVGIGISYCECLIARLGSVMVSSRQLSGRRLSVLPETHIIIAETSQLVIDIKDAILLLKEKYDNRIPSSVTMITGPSRTADIE
ncbi:MAG: LutC/YkgG family protein, partial [Bacteroidota bacterium]